VTLAFAGVEQSTRGGYGDQVVTLKERVMRNRIHSCHKSLLSWHSACYM
jgi:hypothetical protein